MKFSFSTINAAVAISAGLIVLLGYFLPGLEFIRSTVLGWASITAGFALLAGVLNLLSVHWAKITRTGGPAQTRPLGVYSVVLLSAFLVTLIVAGIADTSAWALWIYQYVQVPVETSLLALLAVTLAAASVQLLRRRFDIYTGLFMAAALIALIASVPLFGVGEVSLLSQARGWLIQVPAMAGIRGILMGVALGSIATGLRILMGADRPYGG